MAQDTFHVYLPNNKGRIPLLYLRSKFFLLNQVVNLWFLFFGKFRRQKFKNIQIKCSNISFGLNGFKIDHICLNWAIFELHIEYLHIGFSFLSSKASQSGNSFKFTFGQIGITKLNSISRSQGQKENISAEKNNILRKIEKGLKTALDTRLNFIFTTIKYSEELVDVKLQGFQREANALKFKLTAYSQYLKIEGLDVKFIKTKGLFSIEILDLNGLGVDTNVIPIHAAEILFRIKDERDLEKSIFSISFLAKGLEINDEQISNSKFEIEKVEFMGDLEITDQQISFGNKTEALFDGIPFLFLFVYSLDEPDLVSMSLAFECSPIQIIDKLKKLNKDSILLSLEGKGAIQVQARLIFNIFNPLEHHLEFDIENDIQISNFSEDAVLQKMSKSNLIRHYKNRSLGYYYWNFNLDNINAVDIIVNAEDPNFYRHSGVDLKYLGSALMLNFNHKKFVKGASTITMQMVKNIYLNNGKTLARKFEEVLISLFIENYTQVSKREILEAYLNIIEFAPKIYGVEAACYFYFSKSFSEISTSEAISLTYIIPRPKHFYEALLLQTEQLQNNFSAHFLKLSKVLLSSRQINAVEYDKLDTAVRFRLENQPEILLPVKL